MKISFRGLLISFILFLVSFLMSAQEKEVSGTVEDEDGMSLPGVNITG